MTTIASTVLNPATKQVKIITKKRETYARQHGRPRGRGPRKSKKARRVAV